MSEPGGKEWKRAEFLKGVGIVVVADIILAFAFFLEGGIRTDIGFLLLMGAYLIGFSQFLVVFPLCIFYRSHTDRLQGMLTAAFSILLINAGICGLMLLG